MEAEQSLDSQAWPGSDDRLIGRPASSSTYDEAFLACTDGYCIFDENQILVAYSDRLANLYPNVRDDIKLGISYAEYLRFFIEKRAVQNLDTVGDPEVWIAEQVDSSVQRGSYTHHLHDGRWMQIKFSYTSTGELLFTATDVTYVQQQSEKLRESKRRFVEFASLASNWFWELDENLCYSFYATCNRDDDSEVDNVLDGLDWLGISRKELLLRQVVPDEQLHLHLGQLQRHEPVDTILEWMAAPFEGIYSHVVAKPQFDAAGNFTGYIGCGRDVSTEVRLKKLLKFQAEHDDLTGLRNRRSFEENLKTTIVSLHYDWEPKTLAYIDLDRFKLVNDSSGHNAGDELLRYVAEQLEHCLQPDALLARVGGDEFAIIFNLDVQQAQDRIALFIRTLSAYEFRWHDKIHTIGASAGLTTINDYQADSSELIRQADAACYAAKDAGRNQLRVFDHSAADLSLAENETQQAYFLKEALRRDELPLLLQPVKAANAETTQQWFEVLVSLELFPDQLMSARQLIPLAEKFGLCADLDKRVVGKAIEYAGQFVSRGHDVFLTVNLSAHSLNDKKFLDYMNELLEREQSLSRNLGFEFNESSAHENLDTVAEFVATNRRLGYRFVLDNFGSKKSSFEFLYRLPIDLLKIDGAMVTDMVNNNTSRIIVSAFIKMSRELGIQTVAEYVENTQIEKFLTQAGVDYVQGFGIAEPQLADLWLEEYSNDFPQRERRSG